MTEKTYTTVDRTVQVTMTCRGLDGEPMEPFTFFLSTSDLDRLGRAVGLWKTVRASGEPFRRAAEHFRTEVRMPPAP